MDRPASANTTEDEIALDWQVIGDQPNLKPDELIVGADAASIAPASSGVLVSLELPLEPGNLNRLPRDVVNLLLAMLSARDVARLSQVNHRLQRLCDDNTIWSRLAHARWPSALLPDAGLGGWKQLYGEMARKERGVDTIRIVIESGPVIARQHGAKMRGVVYIHLRKAIRTRGLFLSYHGKEQSTPPGRQPITSNCSKLFPQVLGRFPFEQRSKEDMPLEAGAHSFRFEISTVIINRVAGQNLYLGPSFDAASNHSMLHTLKAKLVVVGMFNSDLECTVRLNYVPPSIPRAVIDAQPPYITHWPANHGPNDLRVQLEAPRRQWTSGEIIPLKMIFVNPTPRRITAVEHNFVQNARYPIAPPAVIWRWPVVTTRITVPPNSPALFVMLRRQLPTLQNHHYSFTSTYMHFSLYYAVRIQLVCEGDRPGHYTFAPFDWMFDIVPVASEASKEPPKSDAPSP